jgi:hypothetical protein
MGAGGDGARASAKAWRFSAQIVCDKLLRDSVTFGPGSREMVAWALHGRSGGSWTVEAEVLPNAVWRRGRLLL